MSNRDQSASPPAAGSITVATGPAPSSPRGQQPEPALAADTESSITAATPLPTALAPVTVSSSGPEDESTSPADAAAGQRGKDSSPSPATGGSHVQSVAAAATAAATAASATDAFTIGESKQAVASGGAQAQSSEPVDGDAMDGVESTGAALTVASPAAAIPSNAEEKRAATERLTAQPAATITASATASTGLETSPAAVPSSSKQSSIVRGAFVVFEGLDRAGKTTQAKLLQQRCIESGRDVVYMRFPDRTTPIGQMIDAYLRGETETEDHVIHLLFSANRWEAINKITSLLAAGKTIICDRYYHSGIVYSAAKHLASLPLSWARAPEVGLPRPDVVLFLDLDEEVARGRGGWGGEVYERGEMQRRVRELFWGLSMGDLGRTTTTTTAKGSTTAGAGKEARNISGVSGGAATTAATTTTTGGIGALVNPFKQEEEDIQIIDANLGVEELSDKVWEVVISRVEAVERGEVGKTVRTVQ